MAVEITGGAVSGDVCQNVLGGGLMRMLCRRPDDVPYTIPNAKKAKTSHAHAQKKADASNGFTHIVKAHQYQAKAKVSCINAQN